MKQFSPILVNDDGNSKIIVSNESHLSNALSSSKVTEDGIITCFNDWQQLNALYLIAVTVDGMIICFNEIHAQNA